MHSNVLFLVPLVACWLASPLLVLLISVSCHQLPCRRRHQMPQWEEDCCCQCLCHRRQRHHQQQQQGLCHRLDRGSQNRCHRDVRHWSLWGHLCDHQWPPQLMLQSHPTLKALLGLLQRLPHQLHQEPACHPHPLPPHLAPPPALQDPRPQCGSHLIPVQHLAPPHSHGQVDPARHCLP